MLDDHFQLHERGAPHKAEDFRELHRSENVSRLPQEPGKRLRLDAARITALLEECGFRRIEVQFPSYGNPVLRPLHLLSRISWIGRAFRTGLFVVARR